MRNISLIIIIIVAFVVKIFPQSSDETNYDEFKRNFKKDYMTLELLIQTVADFQPKRSFVGKNGFSISNARVRLFGKLDNNFSYFLQTNFAITPRLLDAVIRYKFSPQFVLSAGQFKAPFSKEYLTYAANIDFVNRSQAASLLIPGRDIGFQLSGKIINELIEYKAGMFNGNGANKLSNENNKFLYAGRIALIYNEDEINCEIGLNSGYLNNSDSRIFSRAFSGKRIYFGGDLRAEIKNILISSELIVNDLNGEIDSVKLKRKPYGYQVTFGYKFLPEHQLLIRYDKLITYGLFGASELYILGYNFWPTSATELQLNYLIESDSAEFKNHQYLINFQVNL